MLLSKDIGNVIDLRRAADKTPSGLRRHLFLFVFAVLRAGDRKAVRSAGGEPL